MKLSKIEIFWVIFKQCEYIAKEEKRFIPVDTKDAHHDVNGFLAAFKALKAVTIRW